MIVVATTDVASLSAYARRRSFHATDGRPGAGGLKTGHAGSDLRLPVPVGTVVYEDEGGAVLGDLDREGAELVVARGGVGGRGNAHFKSSVNRAPTTAALGLPGEERWLRLELKLIADAGLVGPPNAGKSSLLRALTAATPKVGAYPFTTLVPELGVAELGDGTRLVVADIPGLVEGAAEGRGLGLRFLRHVERTRALVYLVDGSAPDPWADLAAVRHEIAGYSETLGERPSLVAVNKVDLPRTRALREASGREDVHWCSALTGEGVPELLAGIGEIVSRAPAPGGRVSPTAPSTIHLGSARASGRARARPARPTVQRRAWGFAVSGPSVERLVARTDFGSGSGLQRFQVSLDRLGISAALEEAGAQPGDTVRIGDLEFEYQP